MTWYSVVNWGKRKHSAQEQCVTLPITLTSTLQMLYMYHCSGWNCTGTRASQKKNCSVNRDPKTHCRVNGDPTQAVHVPVFQATPPAPSWSSFLCLLIPGLETLEVSNEDHHEQRHVQWLPWSADRSGSWIHRQHHCHPSHTKYQLHSTSCTSV